jgi:phosphatidylglycerophosphate synthase
MSLSAQYKLTLKPLAIEEPLDIAFYRPLGFSVAKLLMPFPITPNQVTLVSMLCGIAAGVLYAFGKAPATFIAGVLFLLANLFDCADGQLARLKQIKSDLGRIIDGFADYITGLVVLLGMGIGYFNQFYAPLLWWGLIIAAIVSNMVQSVLLDAYRSRYMALVTGRIESLQDEYNEFEEKCRTQSLPRFDHFIIGAYLFYLRLMIKTAPSNLNQQHNGDRDYLIKRYTPFVRAWTCTGSSTRITIAAIASLLNRPDVYLLAVVIPINIFALFLYILQTVFDGKERRNS